MHTQPLTETLQTFPVCLMRGQVSTPIILKETQGHKCKQQAYTPNTEPFKQWENMVNVN